MKMKLKICNAVENFHSSCQSCESYSFMHQACRDTGVIFPQPCKKHSHVVGTYRKITVVDRWEAKELFDIQIKETPKQLELF